MLTLINTTLNNLNTKQDYYVESRYNLNQNLLFFFLFSNPISDKWRAKNLKLLQTVAFLSLNNNIKIAGLIISSLCINIFHFNIYASKTFFHTTNKS